MPYILKHCANEIAPILQVIFTQSLSTGSLLNDWLSANICPVLKKGNRNSASNYRPISLTSIEDISYVLDHQKQIDIILLDFSKAFNSVPHQQLLTKLRHYGISNSTLAWIEHWLTRCSQCVALDGETSNPVPVLSGVPQGTVLGLLMFLLCINDITKDIDLSACLQMTVCFTE